MPEISLRLYNEITLRLVLCIIYLCIGLFFDPVERVIQREESWRHRYPMTKSYCPILWLWFAILLILAALVSANYYQTRQKDDRVAAVLAFTLSIATTAVLTRLLKYVTGKPRPDFLDRCKPRCMFMGMHMCSGVKKMIREGRQSFPSGHASLAFSGLGFSSLYVMGKLQVYFKKGPGEAWRIICCLTPIAGATCVGLSRISDYHHFAVDVLAGSLIGLFTTLVCYHQYYPPFYSPDCNKPYPSSDPPPPSDKKKKYPTHGYGNKEN